MEKNSYLTLNELSGLTPSPLDAERTALIVIDAQEEYLSGRLPLAGIGEALVVGIQTLKAARDVGMDVVHVFHRGVARGLFGPDSPYFKPISGFEPASSERVLYKGLPNAFATTELHSELQLRNINTLILCGFMTHMCVESTARAALDLGYEVRIVPEATATRSLPSMQGPTEIRADSLQAASLAALADRFAFPIAPQEIEELKRDR